MALIGALACSRVIGEVKPQALRVATWQIPGIDGYGIHILGLGDAENVFRVVQFGVDAVIVGTTHLPTWLANLRSLQGTIVTITNDQGTSIANQLIVAIGDPQSRTANNLVNQSRRLELQLRTITV